ARRGQAWHGTDRQVRGAVLQLLRDAPRALSRTALADAGPDAGQLDRCIASLVEDGLVEPVADAHFRLPH
ncbi:MAG TPA: A/G-specific adenine glycosylase, partial [Ornithinibacter sp.]|nr:A/G-specific adenine glycosylase [Ornithinibacter sp.]